AAHPGLVAARVGRGRLLRLVGALPVSVGEAVPGRGTGRGARGAVGLVLGPLLLPASGGLVERGGRHRPGTGEPLLRPLVVELAGGRAVHGVVGAAVVGAPVLGLPVVGLPVVGLPVVGPPVVGLPVVGLPVVGPSVVGPSVIGTAQRAVLR